MPYSKNPNNLKRCVVCNKKFYRQRKLQECCSKKCSLVIIHKKNIRYKNEKERQAALKKSKKKYELKNKEIVRKSKKNWRDRNKEKISIKAKSRNSRPEIKLKRLMYERIFRKTPAGIAAVKRYKKSAKGKLANRIDRSKRRRFIKEQTPSWNDSEKMKKIYWYASKIEEIFNQPVHVDHIIPIRGKTFEDGAKVCGLNVWYNLDFQTKSENLSKNNLCPPVHRQPDFDKNPHVALVDLPKPKDWMKYIRKYYLDALVAEKLLKENPSLLKEWNQEIGNNQKFIKNPRRIKK